MTVFRDSISVTTDTGPTEIEVFANKPIGAETFHKIRDAFGEPAAHDGKTLLFDEMPEIKRSVLADIARSANQPATVGLHGEGEIVTLSDGTRYRATPNGWRRLPDSNPA